MFTSLNIVFATFKHKKKNEGVVLKKQKKLSITCACVCQVVAQKNQTVTRASSGGCSQVRCPLQTYATSSLVMLAA
jgi:hypothetical protein